MATVKFVQAKATALKAAISSTEVTEIVLTKLLDIYGNTLALADFGDILYLTFSPGGSNEEIISATGFTVNDDGSVSIDAGIVRALQAKYPYTSGGTASSHSAGEVVVVSNNPQLYASLVALTGDQTIAGVKLFSSAPQSSVDPVSANDLARLSYIQALVLGTLTTIDVIVPGTAGTTIAAGNLIYYDDATNTWKLCDADDPTTVDNVLLAIAQGAGTNGNPISNGVLLQGQDAHQSGLTEGQTYYASNTAGGISSTPGTTSVTIGIGKSATTLYFSPRFNEQVTEKQRLYLIAFAAGTDFYGASVVGTDSYAITPSPAVAAYATGMRIRFKADVANTGACTLAVSGLAAITIKKMHDQDLSDGDIEAGSMVEVIYDGTNFQMQTPTAVAPAGVDVQTFSTHGSFTWTKPAGALVVEVHLIGAGGGGTAGTIAATTGDGGPGGGGGSYAYKRFLASALGATETVVVGQGGTGGATSGAQGTDGGFSAFGTTVLAKAPGGSKGGATSGSGGTGGAGGVVGLGDITVAGGAGGNGNGHTSGGGSAGVDSSGPILTPRGGGGGYDSESVSPNNGFNGGGFTGTYVLAGGLGGTSSTYVGSVGATVTVGLMIGGTGGGGGGEQSQRGTNGRAGGAGGFPGGGGGGGSAAASGTVGVGGAGADGCVIVITYF